MNKKYLLKILGIVFPALMTVSCIVPYEPRELLHQEGTLVVEGNISITGPFDIQISRSAALPTTSSSPGSIQYEHNAQVYVRDGNGTIYMSESHSAYGEYHFDFSNQSPNVEGEYQLVIELRDGTTYESDLRKARNSSNMELHYKIDTLQEKVIIYVDTYDISGESTHYNWKFRETWDYVSQIMSLAYLEDNVVKETENFRPWMYRCWDSRESSEILLVETSSLSEDRINDLVLHTINFSDIRITQHYSIEVIQTVLDRDAYAYLKNMKKNSNDIGDLFSPQPNEISGNIRCVSDPSVRAVGFVSVCNSVKKRLFINCLGLPGYPRERLPEDTLMPLSANAQSLIRLKQEGFSPYMVDPMAKASYWNLTRCIDCRSKGGTINIPSFWPAEWPRF